MDNSQYYINIILKGIINWRKNELMNNELGENKLNEQEIVRKMN